MLKTMLCVALALLLASCVPIGARVQNMYAAASPPAQGVDRVEARTAGASD